MSRFQFNENQRNAVDKADEFFYVLGGTGRILLGTEEHEIGAGDTIFCASRL